MSGYTSKPKADPSKSSALKGGLSAATSATKKSASAEKAALKGKPYNEQVKALTPQGGTTKGSAGKSTAADGAKAIVSGGKGAAHQGAAESVVGAMKAMPQEKGFWEQVGDGLRSVDAMLMGDGDEASWAHGSRLTSTSADAAYLGPAIKGQADRDINIDFLLAIANAKGMNSFKDMPKLQSLRGKKGTELLAAIADNVELGADVLEKIEGLLGEAGLEVESSDPALAGKLEAHKKKVEAYRSMRAAGFSSANTTDGPEAVAKHPNESHVKGIGWVKKKELATEYGKATVSRKKVEYVKFVDDVTVYGVDGKKVDGMPAEVRGDPHAFAGGRTVRSIGYTDNNVRFYYDEHVPCPSWAKR
jgi:hypothetical protein